MVQIQDNKIRSVVQTSPSWVNFMTSVKRSKSLNLKRAT